MALDHVFSRIRLDCGFRLLRRHMIRNEARLLARVCRSWQSNQQSATAALQVQDLQMAVGTAEFQMELAQQETEVAKDEARELKQQLHKEIAGRPPPVPMELSPDKKQRLPGQRLAFRVVLNFLCARQRLELKVVIDQWSRSLHTEIELLLQEALFHMRYEAGARLLRAIIGGSLYRAQNTAIGNWLTNGCEESDSFKVTTVPNATL